MCAVVVLGSAPASADVDCADLTSQGAAQAYLEGHPGDPDRLDADADGQACEGNDPVSHGEWSLPGLAVLALGALALNQVGARRRAGARAEVPAPMMVRVPMQRRPEQASDPVAPANAERVRQEELEVPRGLEG